MPTGFHWLWNYTITSFVLVTGISRISYMYISYSNDYNDTVVYIVIGKHAQNDYDKLEVLEVEKRVQNIQCTYRNCCGSCFIIPIWCIYNKLCFHSWKRTIIYMVFGFILLQSQHLGFPNIASLKIDFAVNIIPFLDMVSDFINAYLILLFVPFGFFADIVG